MFEKWRIKEHMEVADFAGRHVGTVDEVDDGRIKLTRTDSSDGAHHFVDLDWVERIDDNRVYLKADTPLPAQNSAAGEVASVGSASVGSASAGNASVGSASANYAGSAPSEALPGTEKNLFGTSGHGTGMGGSGVN